MARGSRSAGLRGEKVGEDDDDVSVDDMLEVALWAPPADGGADDDPDDDDADGECRFEFATMAAAAAAALAALLMGTWMPSEGRERDLRRVLYGMVGEFWLCERVVGRWLLPWNRSSQTSVVWVMFSAGQLVVRRGR